MRLLGFRHMPEYFRNMNLKQKLLLSYFILIIIPLILLTILFYMRTSNIIENQVKSSTNIVLNRTCSFLAYKMKNIIELSDALVVNQTIQNILAKNIDTYYPLEQIEDIDKMNELVKNLQKSSEDVYRIRIYVRDGLVYSNQNVNFFNIKDLQDTELYGRILSYEGRPYWIPTHDYTYLLENRQKIVSVARLIRNYQNVNQAIGVVSIDILESTLKNILENKESPTDEGSNPTDKGYIYLVSDEGTLITSSDETAEDDMPDFKNIEEISGEGVGWETGEINGEKAFIAAKRVEYTNWRLVAFIPLKEILQPNNLLRNYILVLVLIIGTTAYALAYYISDYNTRRIGQLIGIMRKVQLGNLEVKVRVDSTDEIGKMQENFNYMIERMSALVSDNYLMGKEVKNAELKALQAQINPHFLYNTLDMINWMAIKHNASDISSMVNSLVAFYKLSLSMGKDVVPILDEIMHAEIYVRIQNNRFDGCVDLNIDVEENVCGYSILKLILQPIVENSILHGIMETEEKNGKIDIKGRLKNDEIVITVRDDGRGMPEEKVKRILSEDLTNEGHGYGVRNISQRIKLHYGDKYGLTYRSTPGDGTEAEIRIPAVKI